MTIEISTPQELQRAIQETGTDQVLILDFWSPRCGPCKALTPVLEELARKYAPQVRLAKVNVDDARMQAVAMQLRIQSIPAVKFIVAGKIVHEFVGAQPAAVVEEYLKQVMPKQQEQADVKSGARAALQAGEWQRALRLFTEVLAQDGEDMEAALGCVRSRIFMGDGQGAREALEGVTSVAKQEEKARLKLLVDILERKGEYGSAAQQAGRVTAAPGDYQAVYNWACALVIEGEYLQACDALLRIIEHDKTMLQGQPKALVLALFELLGVEQPQVVEYRRRLASALFI